MFEKTKQDQNVGDGATAAQAGRDIVINHGMSLTQMAEVMREVRNITESFTEEAMTKVNARVDDFEETVLRQFSDATKTNAQAFSDPDFQLMLGDAQKSYARSGDKAVKDTLADIIARRSLVESASREALTLNDAAARAPKLTKAEFATLSLCYLLRYTRRHDIDSVAALAAYLTQNIIPFAYDVSRENASFWHLGAQSCATVELGEVDLRNGLVRNYGGVLGLGITLENARSYVPDAKADLVPKIIQPCLRSDDMVQPAAINAEVFAQHFRNTGFEQSELENFWNVYSNSIPQGDAFWDMLEQDAPGVKLVADLWQNTPLKSLQLNSVGIAIAHANAVRVTGFEAPLSIWIR